MHKQFLTAYKGQEAPEPLNNAQIPDTVCIHAECTNNSSELPDRIRVSQVLHLSPTLQLFATLYDAISDSMAPKKPKLG